MYSKGSRKGWAHRQNLWKKSINLCNFIYFAAVPLLLCFVVGTWQKTRRGKSEMIDVLVLSPTDVLNYSCFHLLYTFIRWQTRDWESAHVENVFMQVTFVHWISFFLPLLFPQEAFFFRVPFLLDVLSTVFLCVVVHVVLLYCSVPLQQRW